MNQAIRITLMALMATNTALAQTNTANTSYDHFAGWYEISVPHSASGTFFKMYQTMQVPVIQQGTNFFTTFIGFEVPLEKSDEGLYLKVDNLQNAQRATLGYKPETDEYYARITHRRHRGGDYSSSPGHSQDDSVMCAAKKTDRPSWLPVATSSAPVTLDDYLGWYESLYLPGLLKFEIYKNNGEYYSRYDTPDYQPGPTKLIPAADGTKFIMDDVSSFGYNTEFMRYEYVRETKRESMLPARHPFVQIDSPISNTTTTNDDITVIGFPFAKD